MITKECVALGEEGEKIIAFGLKKRGHIILNVAKIEEKGAPLFRSATRNIIAPDFFTANKGKSMFVEAKAKTKANPWDGRYGRPEGLGTGRERGPFHGFEVRHAENYHSVQEETGINVLVLLYEKSTGDVLSISVNDINHCGYPGIMPGKDGEKEIPMINIPRSRFKFEWNVKKDYQELAAENLKNDPRKFPEGTDIIF